MGYFNSHYLFGIYAFMKRERLLNLSNDSFTRKNKASVNPNWRIFVGLPDEVYLNQLNRFWTTGNDKSALTNSLEIATFSKCLSSCNNVLGTKNAMGRNTSIFRGPQSESKQAGILLHGPVFVWKWSDDNLTIFCDGDMVHFQWTTP